MSMPVAPSPADLATRGVALISQLQDESGAYPASPTFSAYQGYCWFRDGAFIADGMSAAGEVDSASAFFDWCARILEKREEQIARIVEAAGEGTPVSDAEMLPTRFTFAGEEGNDAWWDFQLDGYGTWLWAVVAHAERHNLSLEPWKRAMELTSAYLIASWRRPCFDWWEESISEVHGSTLGCIAGGLIAVVEAGVLIDDEPAIQAVSDIRELLLDRGLTDGHLAKWLGSKEVDGSLSSVIYPLGVFPASSEVGKATISAIESQLTFGNGVHRYLDDTFFGGGQWPLLSCMLGLAHSSAGNKERARELLEWAASTVTANGDMPEQVTEHLLDPSMTQEWIDRWGTAATPLLWSHAMFIRLAVELGILNPAKESK
ncbi:glycoside hydrolase family 15 protein [Salinibacterium sp. TMP30]|uniref:glycoside hydrolase family 15 protein n=1 Tax=Salinibacterium sp. TMP30 TaxID=3138237 RepID=UPI0031388671